MKIYKTLATIVLCVTLVLTLAACGSSNQNSSQSSSTSSSTTFKKDTVDDTAASGKTTSDSSASSSSSSSSSSSQSSSSASSSSASASANTNTSTANTADVPSLTGDASGKFSSATGSGLEMVSTWAATKANDSTYNVEVDVYLVCSSIFSNAMNGTVTLGTSGTAGSSTLTFTSPALDKEENVHNVIKIGTVTTTASTDALKQGMPATVSWNFRGTYGSKPLENVVATGTIKL